MGLPVSLGNPGHEHALYHEAIHHADSLGPVRTGQFQVCRAQLPGTCSGRASEDQAAEGESTIELACISSPSLESVPPPLPLGRKVNIMVDQHLSRSTITRG